MRIWRDREDAWRQALPGVYRRILAKDEKSMLVLYRFDPGASVPSHRHPHLQSGYVVKGRGVFTAVDGGFSVSAGDSYHIPSNEEHSFVAREETVLLDVFLPPREDFEVESREPDVG